jgi:hypothetical protein
MYVARLDKKPFYRTQRLSISKWNNGHPSNPQILRFETKTGNAEDPRCFLLNGEPACVFNDNKRMYLGYLNSETCFLLKKPPFKKQRREKNWSPFVFNNKLHVLYGPGKVVEYTGDTPTRVYLSAPPKVGTSKEEIRGGTQLVQHKEYLYTIFHIRDTLPKVVVYWTGLMELDATPPFAARRWSRSALWKPHLVDDTMVPPKPFTSDMQVTFPTHLEIDSDGNVLVLAGYHDVTDQVIRFNLNNVLQFIE